jgi:hypothetical protein
MTGVVQTGQAAHAVGLAQMKSSLDALSGKLDDFLTGSFSLTFTPGRSRMLPQGYGPATGQPRQQTAAPLVTTAAVPLYKLSRSIVTIPGLWREWTVGLGGLPSIAALDSMYGSRWRAPSERQYYSMRKVIIDEIMARVGNSLSDQEAIEVVIEAMEQERVRAKASLDKVIKGIKEARKQAREQ